MFDRVRATVQGGGERQAIDRALAMAVFSVDGTALRANANFLSLFGYLEDELKGLPHAALMPAGVADAGLWEALVRGELQRADCPRLRKGGALIWVQATYSPVADDDGCVVEVVLFATDITEQQMRRADQEGQIAAIDQSHAVITFDMDGTVIDANAAFLEAFGYQRGEVEGRHHRMFVDPSDAHGAEYAAFWNHLAEGRHQAGEYRRFGKHGREVWLQASYNPTRDPSGRLLKVVKYATVITREKLWQADHQGQIASIHKAQCVIAFGLDGRVLDANDNFLDVTGYRLSEVRGRHHRMFVEPETAASPGYRAFWDDLSRGQYRSGEFKRLGKDGRELWLQASYNPILDLNGRPFKVIKIATDVSAGVALAAQIVSARRQAEHDVTTALPNRLGLQAFMAAALGRPGPRLTLLYLDLDHFKPINDTFGHPAGDQVLKETALRLREAIGPDQMVARIGGDEFIVAAPDLPEAQIGALCQRLLDIVKAPIRHGDRALTVGLSIGVAVSPGDATTIDDLLRCADVALYRTKGNGRDGYSFYTVKVHEPQPDNRHLADELRHGIQAQQFFLEYRPRFDARTQQLDSVEVLVR